MQWSQAWRDREFSGAVKSTPKVKTGLYALVDLGFHKVRKILAPVVQKMDSAIHWKNHYPLDNSIAFPSVFPLNSHLSGGQRYPSFEQLGPGF